MKPLNNSEAILLLGTRDVIFLPLADFYSHWDEALPKPRSKPVCLSDLTVEDNLGEKKGRN